MAGKPYMSSETGSAERTAQAAAKAPDNRDLNRLSEHRYAEVQQWRFLLNLGLALLDVAMSVIGSVAVLSLWHPALVMDGPAWGATVYPLAAGVIWACCLRAAGIYHQHVLGDTSRMVPMIVKSTVVQWAAFCALNYVCGISLPLWVIAVMAVAGGVLTLLERLAARAAVSRDVARGVYTYATVVVGSPAGLIDTLSFLHDRRQLNYHPVSVCPIRADGHGRIVSASLTDEQRRRLIELCDGVELSVLAYDDQLAAHAVRLKAHTVMVADVLHRDSEEFGAFSLRVEALGLQIALRTSAADIGGHELTMRMIRGVTIMTISLPQYGVVARVAKRIFDIVVSLIAIVVSSPIMLAVAIAIKLDDGGPVLYAQERIGLRGRPFRIWKFRSMGVDADKHDAEVAAASGQELGARFKVRDDPRVTRVGHVIRRTSLDELPQFFNTLLGTMSVVGPRPQRQYEVDEYTDLYATRLLVKPGITGPWQVSGRNDLSEEESQQLDVSYVRNWSILGDIVYIFRTVGVMLHPKGAY